MLLDLIDQLFDDIPRRHGWTWQRFVIVPLLSMAAFVAIICLVLLTSGWWFPALLASTS